MEVLRAETMLAASEADHFFATFCKPNLSPDDFKHQLGRFTPCFTDVVVLGVSELVAIVLLMWRLLLLVKPRPGTTMGHLQGAGRLLQGTDMLAAITCALISILQLQARITASAVLITGKGHIAPYEWVGYSLPIIAFSLLAIVSGLYLDHYRAQGVWMSKFPVVLMFAAQLAKVPFVVVRVDHHDFFFILYMVLVASQAYSTLLAFTHFPQPRPDCCWCTPADYEPLGTEDDHEADDAPPAVCPEEMASLWSKVTFSWMGPLMRAGYLSPLEQSDIWPLPKSDMVGSLNARFNQLWRRELAARGGPSLSRACSRMVAGLFLWALPFKLCNDASQFVGPIFLNLLLTSISDMKPLWLCYSYAVLMWMGLVLGALADAQQFQRTMRAGFRLRSVLVSQVYRKVLLLVPSARSSFTSGRIFNLVTSDAETLQALCQNIFGFMSAPFRIVGSVLLLYQNLGVASLTAVVLLVLFMPLQAVMVRIAMRLMRQALGHTDERAKLEGEFVSGIDVVKCYAWETAFLHQIRSVRDMELGVMWKSAVVSSLNSFLLNVIPTLVSVGTFGVYVWLGGELTAAVAFTSLSLLSILRFPLFQLPQLINQFTQARVALKRLEDFLKAAEQEPMPLLPAATDGSLHSERMYVLLVFSEGGLGPLWGGGGSSRGRQLAPGPTSMESEPQATTVKAGHQVAAGGAGIARQDADRHKGRGSAGGVAVRVKGDFGWSRDEPPALLGVSLEVKRGQLVAVVGATGSGKSSLLCAMLGLCEAHEGSEVILRSTVAYVPQAAFIFNATVRDNILFGNPCDEQRYLDAISAANLGNDLLQLPAGDQTELGERGINVSGGQKQRISLARAVFSGADVVLLDDPLSALDARVARSVYQDCIRGVLASKSVVLVTNQLQFVNGADIVVFMSDGQIAEMGTFDELMAREGGFFKLVSETQVEEAEEAEDAEDGKGVTIEAIKAKVHAPRAQKAQEGGELTTQEHRSIGVVSGQVLWVYMRAMGGAALFLLLMLTFVGVEACRTGTNLWLKYWTSLMNQSVHAHDPLWYLNVYALISAVQVMLTLVNQFSMRAMSLQASRRLHDSMLGRLARAPMSFFHTTPSGRIINRFTKDTSDVDRSMVDFTTMFIRVQLQLLATLMLVGVVTPFSLPMMVPLMLLFYMLYVYFQTGTREVKRLDALSRSPLYTAIGEALNGLGTIRAFRSERRLMSVHSDLLDSNVVLSLVNQSMNRWLGIRLETLGATAAFGAAVLAIEQRGDASTMGLVLSYALQITMLTSITLRVASIAENSFNAVERIHEYSQVDQEADAVIPDSVPNRWPLHGHIEFQDVQLRYRPGLPLVLRGVTADLPAASKVGVVGRTGAGKSSLINSLFRLSELAGGRIHIDGQDIAKIGLQQLRAAMSIIPQTPVLFTGTLRANLSPFGDHTDADIWTALRRAHLSAAVEANPLGLDMAILADGTPLSAGQRQLLALARALLRRSKILVLDEATAQVDAETDAFIQRTVRQEFRSCTTISIAHRLHTIIDCDLVMVLDYGQLESLGSPATLLSNPTNIFSSMVRDTGRATEAFLRSVAFGDTNMKEAMAEQVERGRTKVESPGVRMAHSAAQLSSELRDRARAALSTLHVVLEALDECVDEEELRKEMGLIPKRVDPGESSAALEAGPQGFADAHDAIQEALVLVDDINQLAEQAQSHFCRGLASGNRPSESSSRSATGGIRRWGSLPTNMPDDSGSHRAATPDGGLRQPLLELRLEGYSEGRQRWVWARRKVKHMVEQTRAERQMGLGFSLPDQPSGSL